MEGLDLLPLGVRHMIGLGAIGSCLGVGRPGSRYLEAAARQPELMEPLQNKVFLLVGCSTARSSSRPASACGSPPPTRSSEAARSRCRPRGAGWVAIRAFPG